MNSNYLYSNAPFSFLGDPFGTSAALKAKKARLEAIKGRLEGYSCTIEDKQFVSANLGSPGPISVSVSAGGVAGGVAGDKYDEEREQERADIKTLSNTLDTKRDTMVELLRLEIASLDSQIATAVANEWAELQKNSLLNTSTLKTK